MACSYTYKGHTFKSEAALDDFLREMKPYEGKYGDMVFSTDQTDGNRQSQIQTLERLSTLREKATAANNKYLEFLNQNKSHLFIDEDGEEYMDAPPYIGVNKYLAAFRTAAGERLIPEFIIENYWKQRREDWKDGKFTPMEIAEMGYDDNPPKITSENEMQNIQQRMETRWLNQAKMGSAIHEVLREIFTNVKTGLGEWKANWQRFTDDQLLEHIKRSNIKKEYLAFLDDTIIKQCIEYASSLRSQLEGQLGTGLIFLPEFSVMSDTNTVGAKPTHLMGIIDLLIIDSKGVSHIIDFKTSIRSYDQFPHAKKLSYKYQLAVYSRMLEKEGLNMSGTKLYVAPIKLQGFNKVGDKYKFDGIEGWGSQLIERLDFSTHENYILNNIDEFLSVPFAVNITTQQALSSVEDQMIEWLPNHKDKKLSTKEDIIERLKEEDKLKPDENGVYSYNVGRTQITASSESDLVEKIYREEQKEAKRIKEITLSVKDHIKNAIGEAGISALDDLTPRRNSGAQSIYWMKEQLAPYCNGAWEVVDNQTLEDLGVITLATKDGYGPRQVDFIKLSTSNLVSAYRGRKGSKRKYLTYKWEDDLVQEQQQDSLILEATNGNVELMQTMLLINQMHGLENAVIGSIHVMNPIYANGLSVTNEELMYNWKALNKYAPVKNDQFKNGTLKLASKYQIVCNQASYILHESMGAKQNNYNVNYGAPAAIRKCTTQLDAFIDGSTEQKVAALKELADNLRYGARRNSGAGALDRVSTELRDLNTPEYRLYKNILMAIANLRGINFRQQLHDNNKWCESFAIWKHGFTGTYFDNPGNMKNETLNLVTKLLYEAYQNTRDTMQREKVTMEKLVADLKQEKNFGRIKQGTIGNQVSLYRNMIEFTADGDILFKNPNRLQGAERRFLDHLLTSINKRRFPTLTDQQLQEKRDRGDVDYYRVPITKGSLQSAVATEGLMKLLISKLKFWNPLTFIPRAMKRLKGIESEQAYDQRNTEILFEMTNTFDKGEDQATRLKMIKKMGIANIEQNLEALFYKHLFAYTVKDNIDGVFPMIKAAMIHIAQQGAERNLTFSQDMEYMQKYITAKILNQSIIDPRLRGLMKYVNEFKQAATTMTLAFSPVQLFYQPLQGLWTDIGLILSKRDGNKSFTFKNFSKALRIVYKDMVHFSEKPTVVSALNELNGINDMDMNVYNERISEAKSGIWNFVNFMYKFAVRPDYYNRMTIFVAQMLGDGSWEAHHIGDKGELVYDWKKDKRFEAFANGRKGDPEYNKQKQLYYAVARQFVNEGARNADGSLFRLDMSHPMALPRAYTVLEAEGMKSLADDLYGYYSHEKKSLISATVWGGLWFQFRTYWSGKKNQYLQPGGVRLRGHWEQASDKDGLLYYQVDKDGNILWESELTHDKTSAPAIQWKGQWQEGIFLTLANMFRNGVDQHSFKAAWDYGWNNENEALKAVYRANLKQFSYEIGMWMLGGVFISNLFLHWFKDFKKDVGSDPDLLESIELAAANVAYLSVKNSFINTFNTSEALGGPMVNWTPFSFEWGTRQWNNFIKTATGDQTIMKGIMNVSSAARSTAPIWNYLDWQQRK